MAGRVYRTVGDEMKLRMQSAMEYLITYGWAILIIVVVLGALYAFGVFSPSNFSPRTQPGACYVNRPYGPGTVDFVTLEGTCGNGLPKYVGRFKGAINTGSHSRINYVNIGTAPAYNQLKSNFTVVGWVDLRPVNSTITGNYNYMLSNDRDCCGTYYGYALGIAVNRPYFRVWNGTEHSTSSNETLQYDTWYQIVGTFNGTEVSVYVNGKLTGHAAFTGDISKPANFSLYIGRLGVGSIYGINGYLANMQIYNTTLSANTIHNLYQEGIGGSPVELKNLIGWWPLNGNAKDYSGNGYDAINEVSVSYYSEWTTDYTTPSG